MKNNATPDSNVLHCDIQRLNALAAILFRCFAITVIAMVFVWIVAFVARTPIQQLHESMFGLTPHEFDLFLYGFLTLIKCLNVVLFLFPWVAVRWYLAGIK